MCNLYRGRKMRRGCGRREAVFGLGVDKDQHTPLLS